jgi:hypothetical protein
MSPLEDNVLVLLSKHIGRLWLFLCCYSSTLRLFGFRLLGFLLSLCKDLSILGGRVPLLLVGHFLQSVEFFSVKFIEFRVDIYI